MRKIKLHQNLLISLSDKSDGNIDYRFSPKAEVKSNRHKIFKYLNLSTQVVEVEQIHGSQVSFIDQKTAIKFPGKQIPKSDGMVTNLTKSALMTRLADCIPIVLYDPQNHAVGLIHAGWRGAIQKIHLHAIIKMTNHFNSKPTKLKAWLGPALQSCCYTTNKPPTQRVLPEWQSFISQKNKTWHIDYPGSVIDSLINVGVNKTNIVNSNQCTGHDKKQWFSYQRHKKTNESDGRFVVIVKLL